MPVLDSGVPVERTLCDHSIDSALIWKETGLPEAISMALVAGVDQALYRMMLAVVHQRPGWTWHTCQHLQLAGALGI